MDADLPVGATEIAAKLNVARGTVDQWGQRGLLPERDWTVGGRPAWRWSTIQRWAEETGRWTPVTLADLAVELGVRDVERVARQIGALTPHDPRTGRVPHRWTGKGLGVTFTRDEADELVAEWHHLALMPPTSYPDGTLPTERMPGSHM